MKANEVPEKLYFRESDKGILDIYSAKESDDDIEYVRTDAVIKKAENYLRNECQRFILTEKDIDDFVKHMQGE